MQKKFTKESKEREMFGAFWEMCQKYWIPEASEDYWKQLTEAGDKFVAKYKNLHPAVVEIVAGFISGCSKKYEESKQ